MNKKISQAKKVGFGGGAIGEDDYNILVEYTKQFDAPLVLEFGPGTSTQAFIDGGALKVFSYEHNEKWFKIMSIAWKYDDIVSIYKYDGDVPFVDYSLQAIDFAFVDSPEGRIAPKYSRMHTMNYSSLFTDKIWLHDTKREKERHTIDLFKSYGRKEKFYDTKFGLSLIYKE